MQAFFTMQQYVRLIEVGEPIAHRAAKIGSHFRRLGQRMPFPDLLIAGTALERGLTLVARTPQALANVPGLVVVDWAVP